MSDRAGIIMAGIQVGFWTVLEKKGANRRHRTSMFLCRCVCGTERVLAGKELRQGTTRSCGCQQYVDDTGAPFGRQRLLKTHRNSTGFRGVHWDSRSNKFRAELGDYTKGTRVRSRRFDTAKEAALAYDSAARLRYGANAALNFPRPAEIGTSENNNDYRCPNGHDLSVSGYIPPKRLNLKPQCRICNADAQTRMRKRRRLIANAALREEAPP